jgi:YidC/Oxa1 family membrane protein insertase
LDIFAFFNTLLTPIKWVIEAILVGFHWFWTNIVQLDPNAGLTWVLSIVGLVLVVRAALIPIFVRQIRSQRKMLEISPQLKKIQDKYKGKKDQFSREAMSRETMGLYKKAGTNPFASCLPLLLQMPIFFGLFSVLSNAQHPDHPAGVGLLDAQLAESFGTSSLFGIAPLHLAISTSNGNVAVIVIAVVMVVLMTGSQFITQLQIMSKNQSAEMKASPMFRQQRILLYLLPLVFAFSGFTFPIGVMFYWLVSNFWTMGQQFLVIRNSPTPGSEAALAREVRLAKRDQRRLERKGFEITEHDEDEDGDATGATKTPPPKQPKPPTQRQQPPSRNRAKKQQKKRGGR